MLNYYIQLFGVRKHFLTSLLAFVLFTIFTEACSPVESNCICTDEFATSTITIINANAVPVDSLDITIKDKDGNKLYIKQDFYSLVPGRYIVLNDGFLNLLCGKILPQQFSFAATDGEDTVSAKFLFSTDDCCCHIHKVAGPDTLVIR
jgi:hypothetical protein